MSVSEVGRFPLQTAYKPPNPSDAVWAAYFGLFYRKFFWDFVSGTLRDPGGLQCVIMSLFTVLNCPNCSRKTFPKFCDFRNSDRQDYYHTNLVDDTRTDYPRHRAATAGS